MDRKRLVIDFEMDRPNHFTFDYTDVESPRLYTEPF
jgi:hypothetical protein